MLGKLNQRLKRKSESGQYNDLDGESSITNDGRSTSPFSNSFGFLGGDSGNGGLLGSAIEMSAAGAGVVPDDTFTVDQAVNATGFGRFQVKLSLITGLSWMADSMEMMILSIISPALKCDWRLPDWKQALITTGVFLGMMMSAVFWGQLSDKYGRKKALALSAVLLSIFGLLSSFSPTFFWILLLRLLVGFAIGCTPQSVTLYAEFLPVQQRGKCVVLLDSFWALGACFEVLLALIIMPTLGWRWLLALSTIPVFVFTLVCAWLPESARFLAANGRTEEALAVLRRIAEENGKPMLAGRLIVDDLTSNDSGTSGSAVSPSVPGNGDMNSLVSLSSDLRWKSPLQRLLSPELKLTSLLLWFIWLACAFCYYGMVLMSTELLAGAGLAEEEGDCLNRNRGGNSTSHEDCSAGCRVLTSADYTDLLWTTLAEFPGIVVTLVVIEFLGRKKTMALEFFIFSLTVFLIMIVCISNRSMLTFMLFLARGIISGVFQAAYVYTPEVYPTYLRSVGIGVCSGMARLGAMVTPFVAQVLVQDSLNVAIGLYGSVSLLAMVASLCLPIETKGRAMS
ncbi:Synaptic vesicle 2-related protein [Daphnia magna]|uniref:Synaptic vesicle 2-related protein n=1 Tax=Daphnia magna TaxID=35525 RepID=A0A0P6DTQ1_9CRUS|nr:Synaptic vesicle 2-related protein [Daphnia magna]